MESQYQSSMTGAVKRVNAEQDNIAVECEGYLLEELHNDDTFEQFWKNVSGRVGRRKNTEKLWFCISNSSLQKEKYNEET